MAEKWRQAIGKIRKGLAIKNAEDNGPTKKDQASSDTLFDGEQPTLEEIRSWGKSFDKLMRSPSGRKAFREFLRCEYSEENILFWLACEELKKETNPEAIEEKARFIYEDYISILSPKEVSLDSRVREIVNRNMVEPTPHTFDEAQLQIYTLMHRDSYPRFINSPQFKTLAQIPDGVSASGSTAESPSN
ncbi:regulator of G-protein signaling 20 isoform X3 [Anopheles gambiae]|uniref:RGS domain-containing protein n=1 Tax=Anopheles melas TaxID=34690 RepID=A0A182TH05_9DIPT|nr:regulator of G-protein signaling 20 isoform X3 [Anopheles gambiae]